MHIQQHRIPSVAHQARQVDGVWYTCLAHRMGVHEALAHFTMAQQRLVPFMHGDNKMYFTTASHSKRYYDFIMIKPLFSCKPLHQSRRTLGRFTDANQKHACGGTSACLSTVMTAIDVLLTSIVNVLSFGGKFGFHEQLLTTCVCCCNRWALAVLHGQLELMSRSSGHVTDRSCS